MSQKMYIPNYPDLFGNIDFKEGDDARSVYSPAAYLVDLLQMLDKEFDSGSANGAWLDERRKDIKEIPLDAENTTTLIPYLDIVNEVLEGRVNGNAYEALNAYEELEGAVYPFNMPFSLDNERLKNHLHHLGISAHELRRLFATSTDYKTVAREYLGLSVKEWDVLKEPHKDVKLAYDYTGMADGFITYMSDVATFMETTGLEAPEMLELLYQKLYIDPSDHQDVEAGRENFYVNTGTSKSPGYVTLNDNKTEPEPPDETKLKWQKIDDPMPDPEDVPLEWFDRASRFIRLAKKIGLSFTELDLILRHRCKVDDIPKLDEETLVYIAQVLYIHKTLEQPIATVVAIVSEISFTGWTNEDLPQDQFNQIFNLPCVSVTKKYFHIEEVTGEVPAQYGENPYHDYTKITYHADLFSDENDEYRKRLRDALGFTDTDLLNITNRLKFEKVADSSLWEKTENEWQLLNVLYRIRALSDALDVHFLELFALFDLLGQDPFIGCYDPHTYLVYGKPSTQNCFEILLPSAIVYKDKDYQGKSKRLLAGRYNMSQLGTVGNDTISSLKVSSGCTVTLYEHSDFQGNSTRITEDTLDLSSFNDKTSSLIVTEPITKDRLWLFESLIALNKWMKEFGYSPDMLWKIVNGAARTDKEEAEQKAQDLELYNSLLESFKAGEIRPDTFKESLGDERAAHFAFSLIESRCQSSTKLDKPTHVLFAYEPREAAELAENFIQHLRAIEDFEFVGLQLESKLQEKIFNNLVNRGIIDGRGNIIAEKLPPVKDFAIAYDFSEIQQPLFDIFHRIYQEDAAGKLETDDTVEVQLFKSDLKELDLSEAEVRELYDDLIYNGYIDEQGLAADVEMFSDARGSLEIATGLTELTEPIYRLLELQLNKFEDSKVKISEQMFAELNLTPVALQDLIVNLQMNRYLDEHLFVQDKTRILTESPKNLALPLKFYPHRNAIVKVLQEAIATDQNTYLQVDKVALGKIAAEAVSRWVWEDLQGSYLHGSLLPPQAGSFFKEESNRDSFSLRSYFDASKAAIVFDHIAGIVNYADSYRLQDEKLQELDFDAEETGNLKRVLEEMGVLDSNSLLQAAQLPFFLVPENAATFSVPAFVDYDKEIFFLLYDIAKAIDDTVKAVDKALKAHGDEQQKGILEQLQNALGIELEAVKAISAAIFQTNTNLHFAWLQPLLEEANALGSLDDLPDNMHYTQAVKRIRQLALLIGKQQLDINEIDLLLEDQSLVAKFPEDLILPDGITEVDTVLAGEEFIYLFKDNDYWIYLAEDYTLIDKKEVDLQNEDDKDLLALQKKDEERQKRLKEDPIRRLFEQQQDLKVDAAFIDRHGTWVVVSGEYHYVKYADTQVWDQRDNHFGQVDNDFENLEAIDAAYVDAEGRLFLFANDRYVRYSDVNFNLDSPSDQPKVDRGYPKSIAESWNQENLPIQLPPSFNRDLGPLFDGLDGHSYAFFEDRYISSEDGSVRSVAEMWGHGEYDFGHADHLDAALAYNGYYLLFLNDKVVKYAGSIELANLQPEAGYPKALHEEFTDLPGKFVSGIDAALQGEDNKTYLFRDDEFVSTDSIEEITKTRDSWGKVTNEITSLGKVDAAFVGLDGYTYLFSGDRYIRYSGNNYTEVDDGFPRAIAKDWEGLTQVTGAFVLGNKTYLFGTTVDQDNNEIKNVYVRYSTVRKDEDDRLEVDQKDPNDRGIETALANRPDVNEIEVFPATTNNDFWSLPQSLTGGNPDFQIDAVMNGPGGKIYLFYDNRYVEHDRASRWWSEPKNLAEQLNRPIEDIGRVVAAFTGKDGKTYLFFDKEPSGGSEPEDFKFLRFSDPELRTIDNGYPRLTNRVWGKVRNNIEKTGKIDAALVVESRWQEQDDHGQLVDKTAIHTYLFSGDQTFRYEGNVDVSSDPPPVVEPGYPRSILRLSEEPRFRDLPITFPEGLDAAFADQRQVYLFKGNSFHVAIGDEKNYKKYEYDSFNGIKAATQEWGVNYVLNDNGWRKLNHLEDRQLTLTEATPRAVQKAEGVEDIDSNAINAVLHGTNGKSYVFAENQYYDPDLERSFPIAEVWGRSRNPIYDESTIDAAFVGRDGITYMFSGEWFVQYDSDTYVDNTVTYPPRRISEKWRGLNNIALAYVWEENTYLFERPDANGSFRYLRYTKDSYERPEPGYPQVGDYSLWDIPEDYQQEGFDNIDAIFVINDTLIFISDQKFISFNLNNENWGYPQPLELIYNNIPFNRTDFKDLKSGFVGKDGTAYFFSQECYVGYNSDNGWTEVTAIKDDWGKQTNIFSGRVDAAWVSSEGITYLFAGNSYVRYSDRDYRYVDEGYPKAIATYLREEPAFAFMTEEFQEHLDALEAAYNSSNPSAFFNGLLDNGRGLYFFTPDVPENPDNTVLLTGSPNKYVAYDIDGLGHVDNNFTAGGYVDAAFVDIETERTYLFSGEQYIRYTGDRYRYMDSGYPKIIGESLVEELTTELELNIDSLDEMYRDGIDAAFYLSDLGLVFFNKRHYLNVITGEDPNRGDINNVWGQIENAFTQDNHVDGAYVDGDGALYIFKQQQLIRYSDTAALFALNPYDEPRYVDAEYPRNIKEIWPQLDEAILKEEGVDTVFQFEDEIHFHTGGNFVTYNLDLSDRNELKPVQILAYRWGKWSDYLLSDVRAISRFKDLGQRFTGGELTLTELVTGAKGVISEPYMHFAAIFGFEKEEVRWVKQRNAFLPGQVNVVEEEFQLELVLRLYDILATTQRLGVDVIPLYDKVWKHLYGNGPVPPIFPPPSAADGVYDLLVAVDCNSNYATLVKQINNELNTLKRDALVPYVIANNEGVSTTRQLYQQLLIDIQMYSCADTSRIKEATGAVQLYWHRYFLNLEDIEFNDTIDDPQALRQELKERWRWLRNYRAWEANRKVFLYPENYIRPELRDTKTADFRALQESLSQGELTKTAIAEAYLKYLDSFTDVAQLKIAGGYVYDEPSSDNNKKLVLFGCTRTDPRRYFYRFGTFLNSDSASTIWEAWKELDIKIEATRVEPVFAFGRVFVFWTAIEENAEDASSAIVTTTQDGNNQTVSTEGESYKEIKVFYSFYNLNQRWSQPQALQTSFENKDVLKFKKSISKVEIFVENSNKLGESKYENIYIRVGFDLGESSEPKYKAFRLTPELYSQVVENPPSVGNSGQQLFKELFPYEFPDGDIEAENVVMLNSSEGSDLWFAYNHKGCGFLVKPDATPLKGKEGTPSELNLPENTAAAVQVADGGKVYYFLADGTYVTDSEPSTEHSIGGHWLCEDLGKIDTNQINSAFVYGDKTYLILQNGGKPVYQLDKPIYEEGSNSFVVWREEPSSLQEHWDFLDTWNTIDAAFTVKGNPDVTFFFNNNSGKVLEKGDESSTESSIRCRFGLLHGDKYPTTTILAAVVWNNSTQDILHLIDSNNNYSCWNKDDEIYQSTSKVKDVLKNIFGQSVDYSDIDDFLNSQVNQIDAIALIEVYNSGHWKSGVWIRVDQKNYCFHTPEDYSEVNLTPDTSIPWNCALTYLNNGTKYFLGFYDQDPSSTTRDSDPYAEAWENNSQIEFDENVHPNNNKLYKIQVNVTGAFMIPGNSGKSYVVIITDQDTYHIFDNNQEPKEILKQLNERDSFGKVENLPLSVYLNNNPSPIWEKNKVDAAFIGTKTLGKEGKLYLFCDNQYLRFTPDDHNQFGNKADQDYPKELSDSSDDFGSSFSGNSWHKVDAAFTHNGVSYLFNNENKYYRSSDPQGVIEATELKNAILGKDDQVDAAYAYEDNKLYLIVGNEYYHYDLESKQDSTFNSDRSGKLTENGDNIKIDAAFILNDRVYLFSGTSYYRLDPGNYEPSNIGSPKSIAGNWVNMPLGIRESGIDLAIKHSKDRMRPRLYLLFQEQGKPYYISCFPDGDSEGQPLEIDDEDVKYEVIRLTSSTAEKLNQILFAGDIDKLLQISTQEMNEFPRIGFPFEEAGDGDTSPPSEIWMNKDKFDTEPISTHLDFRSANGIYYWEVFFHAPFLIAQTLNADQKFEEAKQWYEYIFDPTEASDYWKFLPFLAVDPNALMASLGNDLDDFEAPGENVLQEARDKLSPLAGKLAPYQDYFLGNLKITQKVKEELAGISGWTEFQDMNAAIESLITNDKPLLVALKKGMKEVMEIVKKLGDRIDLMDNFSVQLETYLNDPFDPHAIAALRRIAYRKAIVMSYIDNLLDWGDMLFRQYTRESIHEARMLYILAYDLLGEKPQNLGRVVLEPTKTYNQLCSSGGVVYQLNGSSPYNKSLIELENTIEAQIIEEKNLSFATAFLSDLNDSITRGYFFLKENELFTEYWTRVEDRLSKIRACLNIDGVAQPLPLFQPPIDPMALVNAVAGGGGIAAAMALAGGVATVPNYRFDSLLAKARELVTKLNNFSESLLSVLEKKDAEELSLLQNKQEAIILDMVTLLKEAQIEEAKESLLNLEETKRSAQEQETHYANLISAGYLPEEEVQIALMAAGAILHGAVALGQVVSGLSYVVPQFTAGPFSFGVTSGGKNVGEMLARFGEAAQSGAEALSLGSEIAGVTAQFKRSMEDWQLQQKMATSEILQLDYQISAQKHRLKMAQQELLLHEKEMENHEAIALFMKSKFSNLELYNWMSGKISGLFFQTYKLAHDYAKQAEQAFIFEKGLKAGSVNYINGMYWDSQRQGLLAGASLDLDLDRMAKAYLETNSRRLEITKNISLLETDPLALLALKTKGVCTFRLSEELFDYDFPGHYNRQIKTLSLAFDIGEGQNVNATLTQLSSKLVMDTDIKAVKHLIDPSNEPTTNVRANWRANQQVALSHVDQYTENNGMFELNFGDERYLPFEGTGAVSNWRLELNGKKGSYNPSALLDVTIKLRYNAQQGGSRFANEVKGLLKPYNATSFFDLAYNFPDEWTALTGGDSDEVSINFTRNMFPNMSSSRIIGLLMRYQYQEGESGGTVTINDLQVPNNTYLQPNTLSISNQGSEWKFSVNGDRTTLRNAEMVLVYKAKV
ncbi:MAG: hypothetical protein F6K21_06795 [Symploca sp. SIO2D2]|nr:hypothetical protein [Symploca sp. SIO2D2]